MLALGVYARLDFRLGREKLVVICACALGVGLCAVTLAWSCGLSAEHNDAMRARVELSDRSSLDAHGFSKGGTVNRPYISPNRAALPLLCVSGWFCESFSPPR